MRFLDTILIDPDADPDHVLAQAFELAMLSLNLIQFVAACNMGSFYSTQLSRLMDEPRLRSFDLIAFKFDAPGLIPNIPEMDEARRVCENLCAVRDQVYDLVVELLRFQDWHVDA